MLKADSRPTPAPKPISKTLWSGLILHKLTAFLSRKLLFFSINLWKKEKKKDQHTNRIFRKSNQASGFFIFSLGIFCNKGKTIEKDQRIISDLMDLSFSYNSRNYVFEYIIKPIHLNAQKPNQLKNCSDTIFFNWSYY